MELSRESSYHQPDKITWIYGTVSGQLHRSLVSLYYERTAALFIQRWIEALRKISIGVRYMEVPECPALHICARTVLY